MDISVTINDSAVQASLERLSTKLKNLKPAMDAIGLFYLRSVNENFDKQQSPDGTPWKRLSATTLMMGLGQKKRTKKSGYLSKKGKTWLQGKRILIDSGDLRDSIHHFATNASVTIGTNGIKYAAIHQFGGPAGRGRKVNIPARPFLAVNWGSGTGSSMALAEKDKTMIVQIINDWIMKT